MSLSYDQLVGGFYGMQIEQNSPLLRLPPEIREMIWVYVFSNMVVRVNNGFVRFNKKPKARAYRKAGKQSHSTPPNTAQHRERIEHDGGLSIQKTCRFICAETALVLKRISLVCLRFDFLFPALDRLSTLRPSVLHQLRRLRMPLGYKSIRYSRQVFTSLSLHGALQFLVGLQLDELIADETPHFTDNYSTVNRLISHANGWKCLKVVCNLNTLRSWGVAHRYQLLTRPAFPYPWHRALTKRDGHSSSVKMYIERSRGSDRAAIYENSPSARFRAAFKRFVQEPVRGLEEAAREKTRALPSSEGRRKVLIVARRGKHADYVQELEGPPLCSGHVRSRVGQLSWEEFKNERIWAPRDYPEQKADDSE